MVKKTEKQPGKNNPEPGPSASSPAASPASSSKTEGVANGESKPDRKENTQTVGPSAKPTTGAAASSASEPVRAKSVFPSSSPQGPEETATTAAPASLGSGSLNVLWGLALLAIVIGGGYATLPLWKSHVPGLEQALETFSGPAAAVSGAADGEAIADIERERDALNVKLSAVMERVNSLEQQLADMRKMVEATALPDEVANTNKSLMQLSDRLMKIEESNETAGTVLTRLSRLEQDIAEAAPPEGVAAAIGKISKRLESLEEGSSDRDQQSAAQVHAQALVLTVGQLRDTLPSGEPYSQIMDTLLRLAGDDAEIAKLVAPLQADAATGLPPLKKLQHDFEALAGEISAARPPAGDGFVEQTLARLKSLVRIRRIDQAAADSVSTQSLLIKARNALGDGDLTSAVTILEQVQSPPAGLADWVRQAQRLLAAERALALLNVYVVAQLAPAVE